MNTMWTTEYKIALPYLRLDELQPTVNWTDAQINRLRLIDSRISDLLREARYEVFHEINHDPD